MSRILSTLAPESGPASSTALWFVSICSALLMAFLFEMLGFDVLGLETLSFEMLGFKMLGLEMLGFVMLGLAMLGILTAELLIRRWSGNDSPREAYGEAWQFYSVSGNFYSILSTYLATEGIARGFMGRAPFSSLLVANRFRGVH